MTSVSCLTVCLATTSSGDLAYMACPLIQVSILPPKLAQNSVKGCLTN